MGLTGAYNLETIFVYDCSQEALDAIRAAFPGVHTVSNSSGLEGSDLLVLAIHPQVMNEALEAIKPLLKKAPILLSFAPKFTIAQMTEKLDGFSRIGRCNPNATSIINRGFNPLCFSDSLSEQDRTSVLHFFENLGLSPEVDEPKLEAYAIVSAMAPTYFWYMWDELLKTGIQCALTETESKDVLKNVLPAAIDVYLEYGMEAYTLIPSRPFKDDEANFRTLFNTKLMGMFEKLKS